MVKETVEMEEKDERDVHVCKEERIEDKVEPKREKNWTSESSLACTGLKHLDSCASQAEN